MFFVFMRCSRSVLFTYTAHTAMSDTALRFFYSLRCLRHHLFTYLSYQIFRLVLKRFAARFMPYAFFMLISFIFRHLAKS